MSEVHDKIAKLEAQKAELERKQKEINAKIRAVRSKELHKKRKEQTHYKVLLGAYVAHSTVERGEISQNLIDGFKKFLNDDEKASKVFEFLKAEIEKKKSN